MGGALKRLKRNRQPIYEDGSRYPDMETLLSTFRAMGSDLDLVGRATATSSAFVCTLCAHSVTFIQ